MARTEIVIVIVPELPLDSVTLFRLSVTLSSPTVTGVSDTVPANPFMLVTVIVDVPDWPAWSVRKLGDADIEKSGGGGFVDTVNEM